MTNITSSTQQPASPPAAAPIPLDIRDVVAAVAGTLALKPNDLMADFGEAGSLGRRIAAAVTVRRTLLTAKATASLFGTAEALVSDALVTLDAILAFTQVSATHAPLAPLIARVVAEWSRFEPQTRRGLPIGEVKKAVARAFQVSVSDMVSARRTRDVMAARDVAIYLARRFTLHSATVIGRAFGGRHHSTALEAIRKITPVADVISAMVPPDASLEDWAKALRREMG